MPCGACSSISKHFSSFEVSKSVCDENAQSHKLAGKQSFHTATALFLFQTEEKYIITGANSQKVIIIGAKFDTISDVSIITAPSGSPIVNSKSFF